MAIITIARSGPGRQVIKDEIDALVLGCFAVHPTVGYATAPCDYTLTHIPTGYSYLYGISERKAKQAAKEILAGPLDWSLVRKVKDVTAEHKAQGKMMRDKYMGTRR